MRLTESLFVAFTGESSRAARVFTTPVPATAGAPALSDPRLAAMRALVAEGVARRTAKRR